jgi:hypothetical protein
MWFLDLWKARMGASEMFEGVMSRRLSGDATDDDASGVGEWNYSIGGQEGEYQAVGIMIAAIIAVVLVVHHFFEWLHEALYDSSYHKILPAIERELMIIGLVAFVFRIFQNLSIDTALQIDHYALEFAELLVPMITFGNCLWGFVFLMVSDR